MKEPEIQLDSVVCILISIGIIIGCMTFMDSLPEMKTWWWLFFIVVNIIYIGTGITSGRIKGDPANALVITTGPIAFYFWTILGAWRKYNPWRK